MRTSSLWSKTRHLSQSYYRPVCSCSPPQGNCKYSLQGNSKTVRSSQLSPGQIVRTHFAARRGQGVHRLLARPRNNNWGQVLQSNTAPYAQCRRDASAHHDLLWRMVDRPKFSNAADCPRLSGVRRDKEPGHSGVPRLLWTLLRQL